MAKPKKIQISLTNFSLDQFFFMSIFLSFFYCFFLNVFKIDILKDPVTQIVLFLAKNCFKKWVILSYLISFSLFINWFI